MYQIKLRELGWFDRECGFCGNVFETGDVTGYLTDETDRQIFLICEDCLKAGIEEFPSILKSHAEYLKKQAAFLEDLSNQTIEYSKEEYEKRKEVETDFLGSCPELNPF